VSIESARIEGTEHVLLVVHVQMQGKRDLFEQCLTPSLYHILCMNNYKGSGSVW